MRIGVLGINHKSADLRYREIVAKACYQRLNIESPVAERLSCILLFTCHRTEIYFSAEDLAAAHSAILHVLREEIIIPFEHKLYAYFGNDCFVHLAQVTAGLDSLIIAETEIQRQVKQAYEQTCLHYPLPSVMHFLFQKSLQLGKYVRSRFILPRGHMTIPKMIYEICSHVFSDLRAHRVLFLGNSEINRKVLSYFKHREKQTELTLCTRSLHSAREMALKLQLQLLDFSKLSEWGTYDIVIAGTNASSPLIESGEPISCTRLIFDLGVPRNIDPKLSRHPTIALINIDELGEIIEKRQLKHSELIKEVEAVIQEKVNYYATSFTEKQVLLCL